MKRDFALWFDRRRDRPAARATSSPGRSHALVIGVSHYRHLVGSEDPHARRGNDPLGLEQLRSTALGAYHFARWLVDEYAMRNTVMDTVRLLLSPSAGERKQEPGIQAGLDTGAIQLATFSNVKKAVAAWKADCDFSFRETALFYAGGHGIRDVRDVCHVLLEDYAAPDQDILAHAIHMKSLLSNMAYVMARTQFYFVDACQVQPLQALSGYSASPDELGSRPLLNVRPHPITEQRTAAVYYSASPKTYGYEAPDRNGTLFSKALLQCLRRFGAQPDSGYRNWQVAVGSLIVALQDRIRRAAQEVGLEQMPHLDPLPGCDFQRVLHRIPDQLLPSIPVTVALVADPPTALASLLTEGQVHFRRLLPVPPTDLTVPPLSAWNGATPNLGHHRPGVYHLVLRLGSRTCERAFFVDISQDCEECLTLTSL